MSTHNMFFYGEITKINYPQKSLNFHQITYLSGPLHFYNTGDAPRQIVDN